MKKSHNVTGKYLPLILNHIDGLTVDVTRDIELNSEDVSGIAVFKDLTLTGAGKLRLSAYTAAITVHWNASLTLKDLDLQASGY